MHETPGEPIEVLVKFSGRTVRPVAFKWGGRRYQPTALNLVHHVRDGHGKKYFFHVSDDANVFKLSFSTVSLEWRMEEIA